MLILALTLRALLVGVLGCSVAGKLTPAGFRSAVTMLGQLGARRHARLAGAALVAAEAGTAGLLAAPRTAAAGSAAAVALFGAFTAGTAAAVRRRLGVRCACFGRSAARLSASHVTRNAVLLLAAAATLWPASGLPVSAAELAVAACAGAVLALLVVRWDDLAFLLAH